MELILVENHWKLAENTFLVLIIVCKVDKNFLCGQRDVPVIAARLFIPSSIVSMSVTSAKINIEIIWVWQSHRNKY